MFLQSPYARGLNAILKPSKKLLSSSIISTITPIVELREYDLNPNLVETYERLTSKTSDLRKSLSPLRMFAMPETGGKLNIATHLYYFKSGFDERNETRSAMSKNVEWKEYLERAKRCMTSQTSSIFVEAPLVAQIEGIRGLASKEVGLYMNVHKDQRLGKVRTDYVIEIRRYQLKLGYDTVPKFLSLYETGLPSKLNAPGTDPTTSLVTLLYTEVGQLNEAIEVWTHGSTSAMERSRVAARGATEWRHAIGEIAGLANTFTSTIYKPLIFSPLR